MLYKKKEILDLLISCRKNKDLLSDVRGAEFIKSPEQYKILEYDPEEYAGILQKKSDAKLLIVDSFPYLSTLNWKVIGEFGNDTSSVKKCLDEFNKRKTKINIM